ncbi:hypothetical protein OFC46_27255, partial [Escherichia coli]|nr:hypothetical protein [Escherichia coli]
ITFINGLTNQVVREVDATSVPEAIRFAPNADGRLEPVVKIVETTIGRQRTIKQYGPDGVLLRSTVQFLEGKDDR